MQVLDQIVAGQEELHILWECETNTVSRLFGHERLILPEEQLEMDVAMVYEIDQEELGVLGQLEEERDYALQCEAERGRELENKYFMGGLYAYHAMLESECRRRRLSWYYQQYADRS